MTVIHTNEGFRMRSIIPYILLILFLIGCEKGTKEKKTNDVTITNPFKLDGNLDSDKYNNTKLPIDKFVDSCELLLLVKYSNSKRYYKAHMHKLIKGEKPFKLGQHFPEADFLLEENTEPPKFGLFCLNENTVRIDYLYNGKFANGLSLKDIIN